MRTQAHNSALVQARADIAAYALRCEMQDRIARHKVQMRQRANLRLFAATAN